MGIREGTKRIFQLHHQYNDGSSKFVAQRELESQDEMIEFVREYQKKFPVPESGYPIWMMCGEDSEYFVNTLMEG